MKLGNPCNGMIGEHQLRSPGRVAIGVGAAEAVLPTPAITLVSPHDTIAQSATAPGPCAPDPIPMLYGSSAGREPSTPTSISPRAGSLKKYIPAKGVCL
jgi:hypothetical protein